MKALKSYRNGNYDMLERMKDEMNSVFSSFFSPTREWASAELKAWKPHVDVTENEKSFIVTADVPGVDPKDVEVSLHDGVLTVRGERKEEKEDKQKNYHKSERFYGEFYRSIELPGTVDDQGISAVSSKGVLTVTIPKKEGSQAKKIAVTEAK